MLYRIGPNWSGKARLDGGSLRRRRKGEHGAADAIVRESGFLWSAALSIPCIGICLPAHFRRQHVKMSRSVNRSRHQGDEGKRYDNKTMQSGATGRLVDQSLKYLNQHYRIFVRWHRPRLMGATRRGDSRPTSVRSRHNNVTLPLAVGRAKVQST